MRRRLRLTLSAAIALLLLFATALSASALDDTYHFDALGMSVKVPKSYTVVTRDTPADDPVFALPEMDHSRVMADFERDHIYLRAYDPDGIFMISMNVIDSESTRTVGNYAERSEAELAGILEELRKEPNVVSAKRVTRGNYIFFDSKREDKSAGSDQPLYIYQCNTIVNGQQIILSLAKSGEDIVASEEKILTAIASSLEFDEAASDSSGLRFEWWRLLLWIAILAVLTVAVTVLYRRRNEKKRRMLEERRQRRAAAARTTETSDVVVVEDQPVTFDEALGYREGDRFSARAGADLDSFDINVREKKSDRGVSFFEDGGLSIDDRSSDYFESYFREPTPTRSGIARLFSKLGAYIGIGFRHIGYFFRNLFRGFKGKKKQS